MKKTFTLLCLLSIVLVLTIESKAQSGNPVINPYLQVVLLDAGSTDMIDVYATLKEHYCLDELKQQTSFLKILEGNNSIGYSMLQMSYYHLPETEETLIY